MKTLFVGNDISKGYTDVYVMNEAGSVLHKGQFDDTIEGHQTYQQILAQCIANNHPDNILVGLESSGGLERNWAHFFRNLKDTYPLTVYVLNPLVVKRYLSQDLHRNVTDASSAKGIAEYLRDEKHRCPPPYSPELEGAVTLYRSLRNAIYRNAMVKDEFQSLLPRVHPELVQYCRDGIPAWILTLVERYPTALKLGRSRASTVARIPYVTLKRAENMIAAAKTSVASQQDDCTSCTMQLLVHQILSLESTVKETKALLFRMMGNDPFVQILDSIPGIGKWSAICFRLEIGRIERFHSAEALVAFSGLDPRIHQSGDGLQYLHISKHGRKQIRALLYCVALTCVRCDPVLGEFYYRLRERGKLHLVAITAVMRKLLHIIYACMITGQGYDPLYAVRKVKYKTQTSPCIDQQSTAPKKSLSAPISRREAKKRKAAVMPQTPIMRVVRGPDAALRASESTAESKTTRRRR
jgi:transposase